MMTIQLSETTEILLKRIVESWLGSWSGSGLSLMCECMVEHLIHEEAHRLRGHGPRLGGESVIPKFDMLDPDDYSFKHYLTKIQKRFPSLTWDDVIRKGLEEWMLLARKDEEADE